MKYKIYDGLSDYLIAPDGTAIHKDSAEVVPFQKTFLGITAKLITDETHTVLNGKRKAIRLVRRFTREQILKMYGQAKVEFKDDLGEVPFTQQINGIAKEVNLDPEFVIKDRNTRTAMLSSSLPETGWVASNDMTKLQRDIAEASMDHGEVSPLKITMDQFKEEVSQFTQQDLDQLSASKRTVKSSPKAKKAVVKKVAKVVKPAKTKATDPVAVKIPYFRINGVDYPSARKASEAVGVSVNTVLKRSKANTDGWFYVSSEFEHLQLLDPKS